MASVLDLRCQGIFSKFEERTVIERGAHDSQFRVLIARRHGGVRLTFKSRPISPHSGISSGDKNGTFSPFVPSRLNAST
jgi:hypothetical protein